MKKKLANEIGEAYIRLQKKKKGISIMKQTMTIKLNTVDKVKSFVARAAMYPGDIYVKNGKFLVNGKSIMGLFSLNLEDDLELEADCDTPLAFAKDFEVVEESFS